MNLSPKVRRLAGGGAAALVFIGAWFLAISPQREAAAELREQTAAEEQAASALRTKIASLKKQSEQIPAQQAMLAELNRQVPADLSVSELVRSLTKAAKKTHVSVASIKPGTASLVEVAEATPTAVPDATQSPAEGASEGESAAQAAPAAPASSGIVAQPFSLAICGSYSEIRDFLSAVEAMPRAVMVTSVNLSKGCDQGNESDLAASLETAAYARIPQADSGAGNSSAGSDAS